MALLEKKHCRQRKVTKSVRQLTGKFALFTRQVRLRSLFTVRMKNVKGMEKDLAITLLAELLPEIEKLGNIPLGIDTRRLDDGSGIEETMRKSNAV